MNRLSFIQVVLVATSALYGAQQSSAAVPPVDGRGRPAPLACPAVLDVPQINHFDKIVFQIAVEPKLVAFKSDDQNALDALPRNTPMDIKVVDNPRTIADLKAKVLTFIGAAVTDANRQAINIGNVLYATAVCTPKGW